MNFLIVILLIIYFLLLFIIGYPISFIGNLFKGQILTPKEWWRHFENHLNHFNE